MDIRKHILEELDDFEWIKSHEVDTDLTIGQLWLRSGGINEHNIPLFNKLLSEQFNDIELRGDRVFMTLDSYCHLAQLFVDNDTSRYGYVNHWLAENVFCDDDYWEPYDDPVYDWEEQVWGLVESNPEILSYVVEHLRDNYVDKIDETITYNDKNVPFDEKLLNHLASKNTAQLGFIIDGYSEFYDLKLELLWAYTSSYNTAARDEIWNSAYDSVKDIFGEGKWESYVVNKLDGDVTRYELVFDITNMISDFIDSSLSNCFDDCKRYFDPSRYDYGEGEDDYKSEEEAFEDFCEECWEIVYNDFFDYYFNYISDYGDLLNPRFSEWPDDKVVAEYFEEDIRGRI